MRKYVLTMSTWSSLVREGVPTLVTLSRGINKQDSWNCFKDLASIPFGLTHQIWSPMVCKKIFVDPPIDFITSVKYYNPQYWIDQLINSIPRSFVLIYHKNTESHIKKNYFRLTQRGLKFVVKFAWRQLCIVPQKAFKNDLMQIWTIVEPRFCPDVKQCLTPPSFCAWRHLWMFPYCIVDVSVVDLVVGVLVALHEVVVDLLYGNLTGISGSLGTKTVF